MSSSIPKDDSLTRSREIIESYIFATSERNFSIYSERLLMRIVEVAQRQVLGLDFRSGADIGQVEIGPLGDARLEIPIRSLLGPGNTNYSQAKEAIVELMQNPYFVEQPKMKGGKPVYDEKGRPEFELIGHQILNDCQVNVKPGMAVISVNEHTWGRILDFSKGFRRFSLLASLQLSKPCSVRLFRLVSNQKYPMTYTIDQLKAMWGLKDKYNDNSDFIRRTIVPAKQELDDKAPWSFDYHVNYTESAEVNKGRRGRKAIVSVTFFPYNVLKHTPTTDVLERTGSPLIVLGKELYNMLLNKFDFTAQGIKNNLLTFVAAKDAGMDLLSFLDGVSANALHATNPPGYVIRAIDTKLRERYGVVKTPEGYVFPDSQP